VVATRLAYSANETTILALLLARSAQRDNNATQILYKHLHSLHDLQKVQFKRYRMEAGKLIGQSAELQLESQWSSSVFKKKKKNKEGREMTSARARRIPYSPAIYHPAGKFREISSLRITISAGTFFMLSKETKIETFEFQ
jgi:hypothetical protein